MPLFQGFTVLYSAMLPPASAPPVAPGQVPFVVDRARWEPPVDPKWPVLRKGSSQRPAS